MSSEQCENEQRGGSCPDLHCDVECVHLQGVGDTGQHTAGVALPQNGQLFEEWYRPYQNSMLALLAAILDVSFSCENNWILEYF